MKVIAKSIAVVARFKENGLPEPVKFKIMSEDKTYIECMIDRIIQSNIEKYAGNNMIVYRCQSVINGTAKVYEIKYEISTCKWILFKI